MKFDFCAAPSRGQIRCVRGVTRVGGDDSAGSGRLPSSTRSRAFTGRGLKEAVSVYTARAAEKMRGQNLATPSLAVWVETNGFKPEERQYNASKSGRLPVATADTSKLIAAAMGALRIIFKPGISVQESRGHISRAGARRPSSRRLFNQPDDVRSISRMRCIDELNARFGRGTIGFSTAGERSARSLLREFISQRYTTDWNELLRV